ncbi:MAG TPA: hypothetical protein VFD05_00715 [Bacilli bacterium]|nr:hypothetical protein [Bacilli bacterium]
MKKIRLLSLVFVLGIVLASCSGKGDKSSDPSGNSNGNNGSEVTSTPTDNREQVSRQGYDQYFDDFDLTNEVSTNLGEGGATWKTIDTYLGTYEEGTSPDIARKALVLHSGVTPSSVTITFPNGLEYLAFQANEVKHINREREYRFDVTNNGETKHIIFQT